MNKINPKKLLHSKWTALKPINKDKHFIVTELEFNDEDVVIYCAIEALMSKQVTPINWRELKNQGQWLHGWK